MGSGSSAGRPDAAFRRPRGRKAEFWARHNEDREAAIRARQQYDEERHAEAQKLVATHYHRRRDKLARGYVEERKKMPRAWQHVLAARDPETHRSFLPARAILLLDELLKWAPPATQGKSTKAFGMTQGHAAARLGLSMKRTRRGPNGERTGEPHGARRIRTYLDMLEALNIVTRQGRHWYRKGDKWKRLVVIIRPFEEWVIFRYAEALSTRPETAANSHPRPPLELVTSDRENASPIRISRSGCITDLSHDPNLCASSGASGAVAQLQRQPEDGPAQQPLGISDSPRTTEGASRPAFEGGDGPAPSEPIVDPAKLVELSGTAVMRKFRWGVLAAVIEHVVKSHPHAIDAADGQAGPASKGGAKTPQIAAQAAETPEEAAPAPAGDDYSLANISRRYHDARGDECPGGVNGCEGCLKMAAAIARSKKHEAAAAAPPKYVQVYRAEPPPASFSSSEPPARAAPFAPLASVLAGAVERMEKKVDELGEAIARPVRWKRTRCKAPPPATCKATDRLPCKKCEEMDHPFRVKVDGRPWRLDYGRGWPLTLVIDGRVIGPVASWPSAWSSTAERIEQDLAGEISDEVEDDDGEI